MYFEVVSFNLMTVCTYMTFVHSQIQNKLKNILLNNSESKFKLFYFLEYSIQTYNIIYWPKKTKKQTQLTNAD